MNASPDSIGHCLKCGTVLCSAVAEGLCPRCLTRAIFLERQELPIAEESLSLSGVPPKIGSYELIEQIARGGMGVVYRARQISLDREVALKILLDSALATPDELARFRAEASTTAALHHPNIVVVHEVGEDAGRLFFSMDLVMGKDLAALTREGPLPARVAAELVFKVAQAIQHAHAHGILHRDLKPSNVLVDSLGEPHVTDFGLSKRLLESPAASNGSPPGGEVSPPPLTLPGHVLGTPGYMSPEQAAGKRDIGVAADIYSLGALLYHLLTGRAPFVGETAVAVLRQVEEHEPVSLHLLNPLVPRDLEVICHKCLAKDRLRRYASARELGQDLRRFIDGEAIQARPVGAWEPAWRWCRRRPAMAGLMALSLALLITVIAVTASARIRLQRDERLVLRKDYVADLRLVDRAIQENNLGQAGALLDKWRPHGRGEDTSPPSHHDEDLRGFEWFYFAELCRGDELKVLGHDQCHALRVAFSSRGDRVAGSTADGQIHLWETKTGRLLGTAQHSRRVMALAFSPDDRFLASGGDDSRLALWDASTLQPLVSPPPLNSALVTLAFSPATGRLVAVSRQEYLVWNLLQNSMDQRGPIAPSAWFYGAIAPDLRTVALPMPRNLGVALWNCPPTSQRGRIGELGLAVAFSADGQSVATGELSGQIRVWDATSLREIVRIPTQSGVVGALAWSPDGKRLASGGHDAFLRVWEIPAGRLLATYRGHRGFIFDAAYSPDAQFLATASTDGTIRLWDAMRGPLARPNPERKNWGMLQPRGRALAVSVHGADSDTAWIEPKSLRLFSIPLPPELRHTNTIVQVIDDGFLVFGPDAFLRRFDRSGKAVSPALPLPRWPVFHPMSSPNGRWLTWQNNPEEIASRQLWKIGSAAVQEKIGGPGTKWFMHTFSYDSRSLAIITSSGDLQVLDLSGGRLRRPVPSWHGIPNALSFSWDGRLLVASWQDGTISLWDAADWDTAPASLVTGTEAVWCVSFSPDGRRVVGGGDDGDVFVWDVSTRQLVAKLKAPEHTVVLGVGFSADGGNLFASTTDSVCIWRTQTNTALR